VGEYREAFVGIDAAKVRNAITALWRRAGTAASLKPPASGSMCG
jgi:hypothetical protein